MIDGDFSLEVTRKFPGHLARDPILPKRGLNKYVDRDDQEEQGEKKPL